MNLSESENHSLSRAKINYSWIKVEIALKIVEGS